MKETVADLKNRIQELARKVKGTNIQEVVDDPEWQKLRLWFKGKWASQGPECAKKLRDYFEKDKNDPWRVRRVLNYVTCSGFRTGAIKEPSIDALRDEVRTAWSKLLGDKATHRSGGKL
jgi:hypothetical protein